MYLGHLSRIFPDSSPAWRKNILRSFWRTHQRAMLGLFACDIHSGEEMLDRVEWAGRDILDSALASGKGVLLLVPHFGDERTLHILLAMAGYPVHVISTGYDDAPEIVRRTRLEASRRWHHLAVTGESPRWMYDALGRGELVQIAPTAYGGPKGSWVESFGVPVLVPSTPSRLRKATGCRLIIGLNHALRGLRYRIEFQAFESDSDEPGISQELFDRIEEIARTSPDQYNWMNLTIRHRESNTAARTGFLPKDESELEKAAIPEDSSPGLVRSLPEIQAALRGSSRSPVRG